jgi:hypothetical protein
MMAAGKVSVSLYRSKPPQPEHQLPNIQAILHLADCSKRAEAASYLACFSGAAVNAVAVLNSGRLVPLQAGWQTEH